MRIAIDCRVALEHKTGDRTYCLTLLRGLESLDLDPARFSFDLLLHKSDDESVLPRCKYLHPRVIEAPNSRAWTLLALPRALRELKPDLLHVQYLAPLRLPCPYVTSIHDVVWKAFPETFPGLHKGVMNAFLPGVARRARFVLCGTRAAGDDIAKYLRVPPEKLRVTPYAADPLFFEPVPPTTIATVKEKYRISAPYVWSVGVQQPRKNIERLVRAWGRFKSRFPDDPRVLVVSGKEGWGDIPRVTGACHDLIFTGYVPDEDVPALYAGADAFAYPSLYEGFGLPILEAMACGCPVLTSDRGAMREVAGGAAQTCNPDSVDSIAQGLDNLLRDAEWRRSLVRRGRVRAGEFSSQRLALDTLQIYTSAIVL
jgi:glycosyltransferase involved in cell wall biosynthesis